MKKNTKQSILIVAVFVAFYAVALKLIMSIPVIKQPTDVPITDIIKEIEVVK